MHFAEQNVGPIAPSGSHLFCVLFGLGWGLQRLCLTRLIFDYCLRHRSSHLTPCPRSCRKRNITLWWNLVLAVWNQGPLGLHDWGIICYLFKLKGVIYTCIGNVVKLPRQITTAHLHNLAGVFDQTWLPPLSGSSWLRGVLWIFKRLFRVCLFRWRLACLLLFQLARF